MSVLRSYSCGDCRIRVRIEHETDAEPERLIQLVINLHGPHCDVVRAQARAAEDEAVGP